MEITITKNNIKKFQNLTRTFTQQLSEENTEVEITLVKENSNTQTWNIKFEATEGKVEYLGVIYYINDLPISIPFTNEMISRFAPSSRTEKCDICGTKRVRNIYHIFRIEGRIVRAGSSCAEMFLNNKTSLIDNFVKSAEALDEDDRIKLVNQYSLESVISACYVVSKGFTLKYNKETTPNQVIDVLTKEVKILDNVQEIKDKVMMDWHRRQGDFASNVRNTFKYSITERNIKIAICGILFTMVKDSENEVGKIGDKITRDLTLQKFDVFKNDFGETYSFTCKDTSGQTIIVRTSAGTKLANSLVIFGKDRPSRDVKENFKITGTIKSINSYGTVLTRCKLASKKIF